MLDIAVGVFLALAAMRLVDHLFDLHRDARRMAMVKNELTEAADGFIDKMHRELEEEKAAEAAKKTRRKPATRKAPAKTAAPKKKGVTNVRRTNR